MASFVTAYEAKDHLRLSDSEFAARFADVQAKVDEAEAIVLAHLNTTDVRRTETAAWTDVTVPLEVKAMILKQTAYLYQHRGDEEPTATDDGLAPGVRALSWLHRDPVVS